MGKEKKKVEQLKFRKNVTGKITFFYQWVKISLLVQGQKDSEVNSCPLNQRFLHGTGSFAKVSRSCICSAPCLVVFGEIVIILCC